MNEEHDLTDKNMYKIKMHNFPWLVNSLLPSPPQYLNLRIQVTVNMVRDRRTHSSLRLLIRAELQHYCTITTGEITTETKQSQLLKNNVSL